MALLLNDGTYIKVNPLGSDIGNNKINFSKYRNADIRQNEKDGILSEYENIVKENASCESLADIVAANADNTKSIFDNLTTAFYSALKADTFPEYTNA